MLCCVCHVIITALPATVTLPQTDTLDLLKGSTDELVGHPHTYHCMKIILFQVLN